MRIKNKLVVIGLSVLFILVSLFKLNLNWETFASDPVVFHASYFNNRDLSGDPVLERTESSIDFEWGYGSPDPSVNSDHFSARWLSTVYLEGEYEFTVTADDGVRLYIDGELVLDKWKDQPPTTYQVQKNLSSGEHTIRMEYYENTVGATAKLNWNEAQESTQPIVTEGAFLAEYFNNKDISGVPVLTREESSIDYDWGHGSPDPSVNTDYFSARWNTNLTFEESEYEFTVTADDGVRLYIDGELVLDKWKDQPPTTYQVQKNLSSGEHTIRMEYYENTVGATAQLTWKEIDSTGTPTPTPTPTPINGSLPDGEFLAEYFNNTSVSGSPDLVRNETNIDYEWKLGSPDPSINSDNFSARWTANIEFEEGNYEFSATADDGVRLWVDDSLLIDRWVDQPTTTYKAKTHLVAGEHSIRMEYYEKTIGATAKLSWNTTDSLNDIDINPDSFSIVVLPDTQKYVQSYPHIFTSQVNWIAENKDALNIEFVLHEGDIVEDPLNTTEWQRAQDGMGLLDDVLPFVLAVGNHDMPNASDRDTSNFNSYFPYSKYSAKSHFGGVFENNKLDNAYYLISSGGIDFMILSLEFGPRDAVLDWANQVVESYPNRKVIMLTHDYVYDDNTLHGSSTDHKYGPEYPLYGLTDYNNGVEIWENFVKKHPNMLFTFSGHVHVDDGAGLVVDTGDSGNTIYQMLANYQHYTNGGNGYLRFIEVNPIEKIVKVKTYSPYLNQFLTESTQQFQFDNVNFGSLSPAPAINSVKALDKNTIQVLFTKQVEKLSSENIANYALDPTTDILSSELQSDGKNVVLTTSDLTIGNYILTVNNVKDTAGNMIQEDSTYEFEFTNTKSLSVSINSSSDDAEEFTWGEVYFTSTDLELVHDEFYGTDQIVGLRFTNINIPQGSKITDAFILFTTDEINSRETTIDIFGELTGNSATFSATSQNISGRVKTSTGVQWLNLPSWGVLNESGINQMTPDLSPLAQEIVNLESWQIGNSMSFILQGNGKRVAYSYDGSPSKSPLLYIEWEKQE